MREKYSRDLVLVCTGLFWFILYLVCARRGAHERRGRDDCPWPNLTTLKFRAMSHFEQIDLNHNNKDDSLDHITQFYR